MGSSLTALPGGRAARMRPGKALLCPPGAPKPGEPGPGRPPGFEELPPSTPPAVPSRQFTPDPPQTPHITRRDDPHPGRRDDELAARSICRASHRVMRDNAELMAAR